MDAGARGRAEGGAKGGGGIGASPLFRHLTAFLGGFCFVSIVLVLQPHSYREDSEQHSGGGGGGRWLSSDWLASIGAAALLFYLITTQVLSSDSALLKQKMDCGIDVRWVMLR